MCRSKRIVAVLLGLAMTTFLSGCELSEKLVTDTGSGKNQDIIREDYLKTDVLDQQEAQTVENLYQVITLSKGTFEEEALKQILKRSYINVPTVELSMEGMKAYFGEYLAEHMDQVEVGDVIATVYTEVDEIAIEEAKVRLQRLEERYQAAEEQMKEDLETNRDERALIYNDYKRWIMDIRYRQRELDWEYEKYNYERQIEDAKEELEKLTRVGDIYEVRADIAGYVNYQTKYPAGKELKDGDYICHIMNSSEVYAVTDEQADRFHYGMEVAFDNRNGMTPGKVVNGGSWILYGNLDTDKTIFKLEFEEDVSQLDKTGLNNLVLKGNLKTMENVIVIPKKAVTVEEDEYFVTVLKEDGTLLKTEFIPGGSNVENYWVLEGLSEGMKIVYN